MQIFELYFNPDKKKKEVVESFSYKPTDVYEKRLGALIVGGKIKVSDNKDKIFLNNLAHKVKGVYHSLPTRTQEEALRKGLTEANDFLKKGGKNKIENLNVAVLSIKGNYLQFSKIGDLKILLSRNEEITDIGKGSEDGSSSFGSVVSGKIKKTDKLIVLTEEIYEKFIKENILTSLAEKEPINNNKLEDISEIQKEKFPETVGLCLLVDFSIDTPSESSKMVSKNTFNFKKALKKTVEKSQTVASFLFEKGKKASKTLLIFYKEKGRPFTKKAFTLIRSLLKKAVKKISLAYQGVRGKILNLKEEQSKKRAEKRKLAEKESLQKSQIKEVRQIEKEEKRKDKKEEIKRKGKEISEKTGEKIKGGISYLQENSSGVVSSLKSVFKKIKLFFKELFKKYLLPHISKIKIPEDETKKRNLKLVSLFILIILTGSFVAGMERRRRLEDLEDLLLRAETAIDNIRIEEDGSFDDLIYHHDNLSSLLQENIPLKSEVTALQDRVTNKLLTISNTEIVENPEKVAEATEIMPSKMKVMDDEIYFYNPFIPEVEKYNMREEERLISLVNFDSGGIFSMTSLNGVLSFFNRPNRIIFSDQPDAINEMNVPYERYSYQKMNASDNFLYFLERSNNQIIRYSKNNLTNPIVWIRERKPGSIVSFAVDDSIWILKEDNGIWEYRNGEPILNSLIKEDEIFPLPHNFTAIKTEPGLPLFVLEPVNKRILIFSKEGEFIKQLAFPEATNIKDFEITPNKIYLLDGQKVYNIEFDL